MKEETTKLLIENTIELKVITLNKKIKNCLEEDLFKLLKAYLIIYFKDVEELKKFLKYLYKEKSDIKIKKLLEEFKEILKEFKIK